MVAKTETRYEHLNEEPKQIIDSDPGERIAYIRSPRWIGYPKAQNILKILNELVEHPRTDRMKNVLVYGESNAGKSRIAQRFYELHTPTELEEQERFEVPVLLIQSPPVPNESRLYGNILAALFAPFRPGDSVEKRHLQVKALFSQLNVKVLVIDEFHAMLNGPADKQRRFLTVLRLLSNELQVSIVTLGTIEALRAFKSDTQLDSRFKKLALPRWNYDTDFRRLLLSFERMLPLRLPSKLGSKILSSQVYALTDGILGEVSDLLAEAAVAAIKSGDEHITSALLKKLEWDSPDERRSSRNE